MFFSITQAWILILLLLLRAFPLPNPSSSIHLISCHSASPSLYYSHTALTIFKFLKKPLKYSGSLWFCPYAVCQSKTYHPTNNSNLKITCIYWIYVNTRGLISWSFMAKFRNNFLHLCIYTWTYVPTRPRRDLPANFPFPLTHNSIPSCPQPDCSWSALLLLFPHIDPWIICFFASDLAFTVKSKPGISRLLPSSTHCCCLAAAMKLGLHNLFPFESCLMLRGKNCDFSSFLLATFLWSKLSCLIVVLCSFHLEVLHVVSTSPFCLTPSRTSNGI